MNRLHKHQHNLQLRRHLEHLRNHNHHQHMDLLQIHVDAILHNPMCFDQELPILNHLQMFQLSIPKLHHYLQ